MGGPCLSVDPMTSCRDRHFSLFALIVCFWPMVALGQNAPTTAREFVYVSGNSPIYGYYIQPNGGLAAVPGAEFGTIGARPVGLAASPDGRFLFATEIDSNLVEAFAVSPRGRLRSLGAFPTGNNPLSIAVSPSGKFLFVGNVYSSGGNCNISVYEIHTSTGALSEVPGSPFPSEYYPDELAVDQRGRYLLSANWGTVSSFAIDQNTGALTLIQNVPSGSSETWLALDKSNRFLYAQSNASTGEVYGYGINPWNGSLTLLPSFPFSTNVSQRWATSVTQNYFIYVAQNFNTGEVAGYVTNPNTGALASVPGSPFQAGSGTLAVAEDPEGRFVFAADYYSQDLMMYSVDAVTGALSPLPSTQSVSYPWAIVAVEQQ